MNPAFDLYSWPLAMVPVLANWEEYKNFILLLFFVGIPALRWVFTKLGELGSGIAKDAVATSRRSLASRRADTQPLATEFEFDDPIFLEEQPAVIRTIPPSTAPQDIDGLLRNASAALPVPTTTRAVLPQAVPGAHSSEHDNAPYQVEAVDNNAYVLASPNDSSYSLEKHKAISREDLLGKISKQQIRRGLLWREILNPPVALRENDAY